MAEQKTVARPYARAAFAHGQVAGTSKEWAEALARLTECYGHDEVKVYIAKPTLSPTQRADFMLKLCEIQSASAQANFVRILAQHKRLAMLPNIHSFYMDLLAQENQSLRVDMTLASETEEEFIEQIKAKLQQKFSRDIEMNIDIDPELIAGAIVRAGDVVIDNSLRGSLRRMKQGLQISR